MHFSLTHSLFEHTVWGSFVAESMGSSGYRLASANAAIKQHFDYLVSDIWAAQIYRSSLGCTIESHQHFLAGRPQDRESVALQFDLPFLNGVDYHRLFQLRKDETDHFERFRSSLKRALDESLRKPPSQGGQYIAKQITDDVIEPALRSIRDRLKASERLLAQKAATNLWLGSLATIVGILAGVDPVASVVAGASATIGFTSVAANKHLEEKRDISLDDAYFLWSAVSHGSHRVAN